MQMVVLRSSWSSCFWRSARRCCLRHLPARHGQATRTLGVRRNDEMHVIGKDPYCNFSQCVATCRSCWGGPFWSQIPKARTLGAKARLRILGRHSLRPTSNRLTSVNTERICCNSQYENLLISSVLAARASLLAVMVATHMSGYRDAAAAGAGPHSPASTLRTSVKPYWTASRTSPHNRVGGGCTSEARPLTSRTTDTRSGRYCKTYAYTQSDEVRSSFGTVWSAPGLASDSVALSHLCHLMRNYTRSSGAGTPSLQNSEEWMAAAPQPFWVSAPVLRLEDWQPGWLAPGRRPPHDPTLAGAVAGQAQTQFRGTQP